MSKYLRFFLSLMCLIFAGGFVKVSAQTSVSDPLLYQQLAKMNLPLVVVNTVDGEEPTCEAAEPPEGAWGHSITNATKVPASMQIILHGDTLYDSGSYVKKESGLTIKIRGNNSGRNSKKSFKLKLQKKEDLLNRGEKKYKDKDWVLLRNAASLVTPIGFWTSELIGQDWTPSHKIVNVWMNGTYRGLYILCEQVTVNQDCRINVDASEGYVVEADPYWWTEDIYFPSSITVPQFKFTYKYPDPEDITEEWHEAIYSDVLAHEEKIADSTFDECYDCESFAKWLVGWELLGNNDSAGGNIYLVKKDASSKISMGPLWDFDSALVINDDWIGLHYRWFYFHYFLQSPNDSFREVFKNVWKEKGYFVVDGIINRINAFADSKEGEDYQKSIGYQKRFDIPADYNMPYIGDLDFMRKYAIDYLSKRADWIDSKIDEENSVEIIDDMSNQQSVKAYDVFGRQVSPDTPGIQIRAGKKFFVTK